MSWLHRARGNIAPKERTALQFSSAWRHRIEITKEPKDILIIQGSDPAVDDMPFWETKKHFFYDPNSKPKPYFRSFMCAKSMGKSSCAGCDQQFQNKDKRVTLRDVNIWPVIHLDWYYRVQNEYGDPPYYVQPETRSDEREFDQLETHTKVFGKPGFMELGRGHQEQLLDIIGNVTSKCVGCLEHDFENNGKIEIIAWDCPHCGHRHEDIETTHLKRAEWAAFGQRSVQCGSCRRRGYPQEVVGCSQCPTAIRSEVYDVVLPLVKQGSGKDASINMEFGRVPTYIDEYDLPNGAPLLDELDGNKRIFDPMIQEIYTKPNYEEIFAVEVTPEFPSTIFNRDQ